LIVLLGAQVSYAAQNVRVYLQHLASQRIDQRGRELLACRAMAVVCGAFLAGAKPPRVEELAERIGAPPQWLNQLLHLLKEQGLVTRVADEEQRVVPARPPEQITLADVLGAVRRAPGSPSLPAQAGDAVEKLLGEFEATLQASPANRRFSEIGANL
jgi:membrane protein